ncbi:MAG: hypothetical protein PHD54_00575 [Desulfuromonadaceae bacterium]|nr:hypothetical protein [Desulfuromonadaceae bacterium]
MTDAESPMPADFRSAIHLPGLLVLLFVFWLISACSATSTSIVEEEVVTNQKPMYTYKSIVIQDLDLKRELYTDVKEAGMSQRDHLYSQMPGELSEHIERYIKSRHSFPSVSRNGEVTPSTLVLKGRFTHLGRFRVSVTVSLRDGTDGHEVAYFRQTLWDVLDTTETISSLAREVADFINRIQYK